MTRAHEDFLQLIYAEPHADEHKLVYADWLLGRGDPRGELIMLQFQREAQNLDRNETAREQELLDEHSASWLGELSPVIERRSMIFRKGFLSECVVRFDDAWHATRKEKRAEQRRKLMENPAWATVEKLGGDASVAASPQLRSLWSIGPISTDALATLSMPPLPHIRELRAEFIDPRSELGRFSRDAASQTRTHGALFPGLRALELWHRDRFSAADRPRFVPQSYALALDEAWFGPLETLTIRKRLSLPANEWQSFAEPWPDLSAWLDRCRETTHLGSVRLEPYCGWIFTLQRQGDDWALAIDWNILLAGSDIKAAELAVSGLQKPRRAGLPLNPVGQALARLRASAPVFAAITVAIRGGMQPQHCQALGAVLEPLGPVEFVAKD